MQRKQVLRERQRERARERGREREREREREKEIVCVREKAMAAHESALSHVQKSPMKETIFCERDL